MPNFEPRRPISQLEEVAIALFGGDGLCERCLTTLEISTRPKALDLAELARAANLTIAAGAAGGRSSVRPESAKKNLLKRNGDVGDIGPQPHRGPGGSSKSVCWQSSLMVSAAHPSRARVGNKSG